MLRVNGFTKKKKMWVNVEYNYYYVNGKSDGKTKCITPCNKLHNAIV